MIEPAALVLWLVLGTVVGWFAGHFLYGYRLTDDLVGGGFGALIGGAVAHTIFRDAVGGPLGVLGMAAAIALTLVVVLRIVPGPRISI